MCSPTRPSFFPVTEPRRRRVTSWTVLLLGLGSALPAGATPPTDRDAQKKLNGHVETIQQRCLRAYPPELLAELTKGNSQDIPQDVDTDPKRQMQFLSTEISLDKGLFYPTLLEELMPTLQRFLEPGDRFLDLGSGDGRALFLANVLGAHATGIEYDERMVKVSRSAAESLAPLLDETRLDIVQGDFFERSWSGYDLVFYFDLSSFEHERVRDKLRREMDAEALLVDGHEQRPFPGFELVEDLRPMRVYRRGSD